MKQFKIRCSQIGKIMTNAKKEGELSVGCQTYLKDWYAEQMYGQCEAIRSKYFDKGNYCEREAINVCAERLGFGILDKNEQFYENEYLTGTPDVVDSIIIDTKCPWDGKTFLDAVTSPIEKDYEAQLQGYMSLTGRTDAKLCYVLLDTPAECNYDNEVVYSAMPLEHRFFVQDVKFNPDFIGAVQNKVKKCRTWLNEYDLLVKSQLK